MKGAWIARSTAASMLALLGCQFDTSSRLMQEPDPAIDAATVDSGTVITCDGASWWNPDFPSRRALDIEQAPFQYTMRLVLDGSTVPTAQALFDQSLATGAQDLRVVRYSGTSWDELDREIVAFDATRVEIRFRIQESAGFAGNATTYYLYYGNNNPGAPLANLSNIYLRAHDFEDATIGSDGSPAFTPLPAGTWLVADDGGNHVYRATGADRLSAQLAGLDLEDGVFEARMKVMAADFTEENHNGLALRGNNFVPNELDMYVAQLRGNEQVSAISTYRAGAFSTTGTTLAGPIQAQQWYQLRTELVGAQIDFYVDDSLVMSMSDAELLRTGVGLFGFRCDVAFDDLRVRDLVLPEPLARAAEEETYCP